MNQIHCIFRTAEQICAKFTEKTRLVHRSDEFEYQGQRSNDKVIRNKNDVHSHHPHRQRRNGPICCLKCIAMYCQRGGLRAIYVWYLCIFSLVDRKLHSPNVLVEEALHGLCKTYILNRGQYKYTLYQNQRPFLSLTVEALQGKMCHKK